MTDLPIRVRHEQAYVLVVDEDRRMRRLLQLLLEHDGYRTATCASGEAALELIAAEKPDLIVIDAVRQPSAEVAFAGPRSDFGPVPIILLTAKRSEQGIQLEPASWVVDHVGDPFRSASLVTLVRAVLRSARRFEEATPSTLQLSQLSFDLPSEAVYLGHETCLTSTEWRLLYELVTNRGQVVPHVDLLSHVWGVEYRNLTDYLSIFIRGLRNKIEPDPEQPRYILGGIETGYMFAAD